MTLFIYSLSNFNILIIINLLKNNKITINITKLN